MSKDSCVALGVFSSPSPAPFVRERVSQVWRPAPIVRFRMAVAAGRISGQGLTTLQSFGRQTQMHAIAKKVIGLVNSLNVLRTCELQCNNGCSVPTGFAQQQPAAKHELELAKSVGTKFK